MRINSLLSRFRVRCFEAGHNSFMLVTHLGLSACSPIQCFDADEYLPNTQFGIRLRDKVVLDGIDEELVKMTVQVNEPASRVVHTCALHRKLISQDRPHRCGWSIAIPHARGRGVPFQHSAKFHQLRHLSTGDYGDLSAALRNHLDEPISHKQQQSLTNRGPRNADCLCKLLFIDELPLHLRIRQHMVAQILVCPLSSRTDKT